MRGNDVNLQSGFLMNLKVNNILRFAMKIVFSAVLFAAGLMAQTASTGAIGGRLIDASRTAISGANVTSVESLSRAAFTTATGPDGNYEFSQLPPGTYTVRFSAAGFVTSEVRAVTVKAGDTLTIGRTLTPGPESEVTVEQWNPSVEQAGPSASGTEESVSVKEIPLSSRNYTQATGLAPGVSSQVSNATNIGVNTQSVQVGSGNTTNYMVDGAPVAATTGGPEAPGIPNPDAIQGHDTQSWSYSAGPERYAGANISVVTKSGADAFHGTLFEFVRNDIFNANDYFVKRAGFSEPVLKQNQFGFTLGGPIWRSRAFFFASYQGTRQRNGFTGAGFASNVILPPLPDTRTAATIGATFCPANHPSDNRYNTVFGGVQVACDGSNINPVAIDYLNLHLSGSSYLIPGSGTGTFQQHPFSIPAKFQEDQLVFNTDYVLSAKHKFAEKFFISNDPQTSNFTGSGSSLPGAPSTTRREILYGVVRLTSMLSTGLSNEMHVSGQHILLKDMPHIPFTNSDVGITSVVPQINLIDAFGISGLFSFGGNGFWDYYGVNQYQWADQVSWTHGRQTIRLGMEVGRRQWNINVLADARGVLSFNSFADFLLGLPGCPPSSATCSVASPVVGGVTTNGSAFSNVNSSGGPEGPSADVTGPSGIEHAYRFADASAYIHDDIHLLTNLTLNAGVRWDHFGLPADSTGNMTSFWPTLADPGIATPTGGTYAGFVVPSNFPGSLPAGVFRNSRNTSVPIGSPWINFGPRLGFSWQPFGKSSQVIRGGYGIFFDRADASTLIQTTEAEVPYALPVGGSGQANYLASFANPFPAAAYGWGSPRTADLVTGTTSNLSLLALDENLSTPQTQKWNLEVQQQLRKGLTLVVGYAGAHSIHLLSLREINGPQLAGAANPVNGFTASTVKNASLRVPYLGIATNGLNVEQTQGAAKYNGLQVVLSEQASFGFHAQAAYKFSKLLSNQGSNPSGGGNGPLGRINMNSNDPSNSRQQYGPSGSAAPQRLAVNYGWDFPWRFSGVEGKLLSGWGVSGVTVVQSGTPMTISDNRGGTIYGNAGASRAQFCPGMSPGNAVTSGGVKQRLNAFFNTSAFADTQATNGSAACALPAIGDGTGYGNSSVGIVLGPGQLNTDLSLSKAIPIKESKVEFRAEFFNAFNHPQFQGPDTSVTDGTFGQITSTSVNPRLIQFALKYSF
jgi:hypothetical protein